jgi:hypothetical protein
LAEFEIRLMDALNRISTAHVIVGGDDFSALSAAIPYCDAHDIEVWRDGRCVATLQKGALPLDIIWSGTW